MTPEELKAIMDSQLLKDFASKVALDFLEVMRRNEDNFFGQTLPTGLGTYLCLQPIASVVHAILKTAVSDGHLLPESVDPILALMTSHIKEGVSNPSKVEHGERT